MLVVDHPHVGEAAREGYLSPLDHLLAESVLDRLGAESVGASHESYAYAGHQWALAIDAAAQVSAYRPDLLPNPPATWSAVVDLAASGAVLWSLKPVDAICSLLSLVAGRSNCPNSEEVLLDPATGVWALELLHTVRRRLPDRCLHMSPIEVLDELARSGTARFTPLVFGYSNYARASFAPHIVRFADVPTFDGRASGGSILGGAGIAVSSRSRRQEEAAAHAAWLASSGVQKSVYITNGGQPGNSTAWHDSKANALCNNFFADTWRTLDGAWVRPRHPGFVDFQARAGNLVHAFLANHRQPAELLDELNDIYREEVTTAAMAPDVSS